MADQHIDDEALAKILQLNASQNSDIRSKIEQSISTTLHASRDPSLRNDASDARTFKQMLDAYRQAARGRLSLRTEARHDLVKCICNLAADNDANRQLAIEDSDCLDNLKADIESFPSQVRPRPTRIAEDATTRANIGVATLFNICNNHEPALQESFAKGLETTLLYHISDAFDNSEGNQVGLAVDLWSDILAARGDTPLKTVDKAYIDAIFDLLKLDIQDDDLRRDLLVVISTQVLSDSEVQHAVLAHDRLPSLCEALHTAVAGNFRLGDGQTAKRVERALSRCLTDASQLPDYPKCIRLDDRFFPLQRTWLSCDQDYKNVSLAVCALTLLANAITDDASALKVANQVDLDEMSESMRSRLPDPANGAILSTTPADATSDFPKVSPAEKEYFYTATRFLRQLVSLPSIREPFTTNPARLDLLDRLLRHPEVDVAEAALQLYNRTLDPVPSAPNLWTQWATGSTRPDEITPYTLSETIRALHLHPGTHVRLRLEIGLVYTSYTRAAMTAWTAEQAQAQAQAHPRTQEGDRQGQHGAAHHSAPSSSSSVLTTLKRSAWETFVPPLFGLVQQESAPRYWVQGLLGLALATRLPGAARAVQSCVLRDSVAGGSSTHGVGGAGSREPPRDSAATATATATAVPTCGAFLTVLEQRITPVAPVQSAETTGTAVAAGPTDGNGGEAADDGRPRLSAEGQKRTRDNAIVLLCQLLRSGEVDDAGFRAGLGGVASRAGIGIPGVGDG